MNKIKIVLHLIKFAGKKIWEIMKFYEKQSQLQRLAKQQIFKCHICGKPLITGLPQRAHIVGQTKLNKQRYGKKFIDSDYNIRIVCSLKCNKKVDIGKNRIKTDLFYDQWGIRNENN